MTAPGPRFLTVQQVVELHELALRNYGGAAGLRDPSLLDSAVHMPQASFGGAYLHPDLPDMAAAYLLNLAVNHPFVDGNKRTAWLAMRTFLALNGYTTKARRSEAVRFVINVAEGPTRDWRTVSTWIAQHMRRRR